ncbi:MAG: hypothetical protein MK200_07650, partial [Nitrosopumilus sp.]|nr:hypothetical protein [Nitrosopumilus sp.]
MMESDVLVNCDGSTNRSTFLDHLDLSKLSRVSQITNDEFDDQFLANRIHEELNSVLNNPYLETIDIAKEKLDQESHTEGTNKAAILTFLKNLRSLYVNSSQAEEINEERKEKFRQLVNYFSKTSDDWSLDSRGNVVFNGILTNVRFGMYVDYYLKRTVDRVSVQKPLYFDELFTTRIGGTQRFTPLLQSARKTTAKEVKSPLTVSNTPIENAQTSREFTATPLTSRSMETQPAISDKNSEMTMRRSRNDDSTPLVEVRSTQTPLSTGPRRKTIGLQHSTQVLDKMSMTDKNVENESKVIDAYKSQVSGLSKVLHSLQSQLTDQKALNDHMSALEKVNAQQKYSIELLENSRKEISPKAFSASTSEPLKIDKTTQAENLEYDNNLEELNKSVLTQNKLLNEIESLEKALKSKENEMENIRIRHVP